MCKVSVAIAAYNVEEYIKRCINSVINQTLDSLEVIVVNDGSKDSTLKIVTELSEQDKRIKIINQKNGGLIEARKSGLRAAKGEYILFVDGDDWLDTTTLEKLYSKAEEREADIVLYNAFKAYDDRMEPLLSFTEELDSAKDYMRLVLTSKILPAIVLKLIKREFILRNNIELPCNITYAEDLAISALLFMHQPVISDVRDSLYYYYQRGDSVTKIFNNKILDVPKALDFIKAKLVETGLYEQYLEEFNYLVISHLFYFRILNSNVPENIRDCIYECYKKKEINISENKYYIRDRANMSVTDKLKIDIFNINYGLGKWLLKLIKAARIKQ